MKKIIAMLMAAALMACSAGALADEEAVTEISNDSPYSTFTGINLTSDIYGDDIVMNLVYQNDDGTNFAEYLVDSKVIVSYERMMPTQGMDAAGAAVQQRLAEQAVEPVDFAIAPDDVITQLVGYTAYSITYSIGSGSDASRAIDEYIQSGEWDYLFHTLTPAEDYDAYAGTIAEWTGTLNLEDIDAMQSYETDSAVTAYAHFDMPLSADQMQITDFEQYTEIEYEEWYAYDEGAVQLSYERYEPAQDSLDAVIALTTGMYEAVADINGAQDEALTAQLGYPTYRVEYTTTGENGEVFQNVDVISILGDCTPCFHVESLSSAYGQYQQLIESWISALEINTSAIA